jgi:hypothetical protein
MLTLRGVSELPVRKCIFQRRSPNGRARITLLVKCRKIEPSAAPLTTEDRSNQILIRWNGGLRKERVIGQSLPLKPFKPVTLSTTVRGNKPASRIGALESAHLKQLVRHVVVVLVAVFKDNFL